MKKFLTLFLVVVMVFSLSIPAFAEDETAEIGDKNGSTNMDVTVSVDRTAENEKYKVDISWTELSFTYTFANSGTWNPGTHQYDNRDNGSWDKTTSTITVKNHSNVGVNVTATIADATTKVDGVTATISGEGEPKALESAVGKTLEQTPSVQFTVTVGGTPTSEEKIDNQATAKVTITLG